MSDLRKVRSVAAANLRRAFAEGRFYFAVLVNLILLKQLTDVIRQFSAEAGVPACPWVFPFLIQQNYVQFLFLAGAVLLFCDAPFLERGSTFEIIRAGKGSWFAGKLLYLLLLSVLYAAAVMLATILLLLPQTLFQNDWGKVLRTLAGGGGVLALDPYIIRKYSPFTAMLFSGALAACLCFLTGLVVLAGNLCAKRFPGALLGGVTALMPLFQRNFSNLYLMRWFAPAGWMDITLWDGETGFTGPSVCYMTVFLLAGAGVLCALSWFLFRQEEDLPEKRRGDF